MSKGGYQLGNEEVKEESSWRYPLIIFFATLILCVIFLYHYVGPDVDEIQGNKPRPTINDEMFNVSVGDMYFDVAANYTMFPRDRRDGQRETLSLYASWPRLEGYVPARRSDFVENASDSRRIDLVIQQKKNPFSEDDRLRVLYLPHTIDKEGAPFDHNLTRYTFRHGSDLAPASGYSNKEMLVGEATDGTRAVLFCYPGDEADIVPPECYREYDLSDSVAVKYYFKQPYLPEWQRIDEKVRDFVISLIGDMPEPAL